MVECEVLGMVWTVYSVYVSVYVEEWWQVGSIVVHYIGVVTPDTLYCEDWQWRMSTGTQTCHYQITKTQRTIKIYPFVEQNSFLNKIQIWMIEMKDIKFDKWGNHWLPLHQFQYSYRRNIPGGTWGDFATWNSALVRAAVLWEELLRMKIMRRTDFTWQR